MSRITLFARRCRAAIAMAAAAGRSTQGDKRRIRASRILRVCAMMRNRAMRNIVHARLPRSRR